MSEPEPTWACPWCNGGYIDQPTMTLLGGTTLTADAKVVTGMAPRTCKACDGTGRTSVTPGTPPVP